MAEISSFDYQALFAQRVAVSPRLIASGQLYTYDFAVGHPAPDALPLQELVEATARVEIVNEVIVDKWRQRLDAKG